MSWGTNVLVGQSGGPTAVINSSLAGVYEAAKALGAAHVYGMEYGIQGLLQGKIVDLDDRLDDKMEIELLKRTPSRYLGSCRFKLPNPATDERPFVQLFELFAKYCIGAVFYIGGNDSMDTIAKLSAYGAAKGSEIRFIGVPKTIDNDLMYTDHTPGYGSAAKYIATILKEVICDSSVYDIRSVTVAEIMGRHTGWLAGAASLAAGADCNGPDIILLPERPFDENVFLEKVAQLEKDRHNVIIAASEGVKNTYYHGFTAEELDGIVRGNGCTVLYIQTLDDIFVQSYADLFTDKLAAAQSGETLLYRVTDAGFAPMPMEVSAQ